MPKSLTICPECRGSHFDQSGSLCDTCFGTGRIPFDDGDEDHGGTVALVVLALLIGCLIAMHWIGVL